MIPLLTLNRDFYIEILKRLYKEPRFHNTEQFHKLLLTKHSNFITELSITSKLSDELLLGDIVELISSTQNLEKLFLAGHSINNRVLESISGCLMLTRLELYNCAVNDLCFPNLVKKCKKLKIVNLFETRITIQTLFALLYSSLQGIYITGQELTDNPEPKIENSMIIENHSIITLCITDFKLTTKFSKYIELIPNLQHLILDYTDVTDLSILTIIHLNLKTISLAYCTLITDISPITLALTGITKINLSGCCGVTVYGVKNLCRIAQSLEVLVIQDCPLLECSWIARFCGIKKLIS
jgi:hypothetical protein